MVRLCLHADYVVCAHTYMQLHGSCIQMRVTGVSGAGLDRHRRGQPGAGEVDRQ